MIKEFTGFEYLLIDMANHYGIDKLLFEERIEWALENIDNLESLVDYESKEYPQFIKSIQNLRNVQKGKPSGHLISLDAVCSGLQIMSCLTGCMDGALATGLINPNERADAYTKLNTIMGNILGSELQVSRASSKDAYMKALYGSKAEPEKIFGTDTEELQAFYEAANKLSKGAWELLQILLNSWQPHALNHSWIMPDGHKVFIKVEVAKDSRIEVQEMGGITFEYHYYENEGTEKGLSNAANGVHAWDAYIVRQMQRRCNYDEDMVNEFINQYTSANKVTDVELPESIQELVFMWNESKLTDLRAVAKLLEMNVSLTNEHLPKEFLEELYKQCLSVRQHKPFAVISNHDDFRCHANNANHLRRHYKEILSDIAKSTCLQFQLRQMYNNPNINYKKHGNDKLLSEMILKSNYALC